MPPTPRDPGRNDLEWEDADGVTVVRFKTKALRDEAHIARLFGQLERLTTEGDRGRLLLDFGPTLVFASLAVAKLIALHKRLQARGGRLVLCRPTPAVREILGLMSLDRVFALYDTEQEALASFERA